MYRTAIIGEVDKETINKKSGITVVNIDNDFGASYNASIINHL